MRLDEKKMKKIIKEEISRILLTEDQESDSIKKAIALYMSENGSSKEAAEKWVRKDLREKVIALRTKRGGKFILGATRLFLNNNNIGREKLLNKIIEFICVKREQYPQNDYYNKFDKNLNGLSLETLMEMFGDAIDEYENTRKEELKKKFANYNNSDTNYNGYRIVRINSFEEAKQYSSYTSWCVTHSISAYDTYTKKGTCQFYFCLKNGFENVPKQQGEGCPLDEYGLSMVAVCVDTEGELKTCTCRWNHDNGANDKIMDDTQVSELFGCNFYDVFLPNNNNEKEKENKLRFINNSTQPLNEIFDSIIDITGTGYKIGQLDYLDYLIGPDNKLVVQEIFSYISPYNEGAYFKATLLNDREVVITRDGKICNRSKIGQFLMQKAQAYLDNGEEIPKNLFPKYYKSFNGEIEVGFELQKNIIRDGKFLLNEMYYSISEAYPYDKFPYYIVRKNYKDQYVKMIDADGNDILNQHFKNISSRIYGDGDIVVTVNEGVNIVNIKNPSKFLSKIFFKEIVNIQYGSKYCIIGSIENENELNVYSLAGDSLYKNGYFERIDTFGQDNGYFRVRKDDKWNILSVKTKDLIFDEWYDRITLNYGGDIREVIKDNKKMLVSLNGEYLLPFWVDDIGHFDSYGVCKIKQNEYYNLIDTQYNFLLDKWCDSIEEIIGYYIVYIKDLGYNIFKPFNKWFSEEWLYSIEKNNYSDLIIQETFNSQPYELEIWKLYRYF